MNMNLLTLPKHLQFLSNEIHILNDEISQIFWQFLATTSVLRFTHLLHLLHIFS